MVDKNEIINQIMNIEYIPDLELQSYEIESKPFFPIKNLAAMGSAIKPLADIVSKISGQGGSGIYYVKTNGLKMFETTGGFIGSLKNAKGGVAYKQARMIPINIDPTALAASSAVIAIEYKINQIIEGQKDVADFLILQEQAKIKGNINTLVDVLNNYKFNIENEKYKNNKHILIQAIKNESEKSILLVQSLIKKALNKKTSIHFEKAVDEYIKESIDKLNDYQLGIYQFAFSSFLEIILLENFDENYINSVMKNIAEHKEKYALLCKKVTEKVQKLSETSVQNGLILGVSKVSAGISKLIEKTPLNKTQLDENLLAHSKKLLETKNDSVNKKVQILSNVNANLIEPFEKTIEMIKHIYNDNYNVIFDSENIYLDIK